MQTLVAVKRFRYNARTIEAGEELMAESELDEKIIIHTGNAEVKRASESRRTYNRRDLRAKP